MLEKNYLKFGRNSSALRSASTLCEIASRTRSHASLVRSALQLPHWLKRNSSKSLLVVWLLDGFLAFSHRLPEPRVFLTVVFLMNF